MDDDIGLAEKALRAQGQQVGRAGPCAHQVDEARGRGIGGIQRAGESRLRLRRPAGESEVRGGPGEHALQEAPPRAGFWQDTPDGSAHAAGQRGEQAERRRQHCLDPLPHHARQHLAGAAGRNRARGLT